MKDSLRRVWKNAAILLFGSSAVSAVGVVTLAILTHFYGAKVFGVYILLRSFHETVVQLLNVQTWQGFLKCAMHADAANRREHLKDLFHFCLFVDVISIAVSIVVSLAINALVSEFYEIPEYQSIGYVVAFSALCNLGHLSYGVFRFYNKFAIQSKIDIVLAVLCLISAALIAWCEMSIEFYAASFIALSFAAGLARLMLSFMLLADDCEVYNLKRPDRTILKSYDLRNFLWYNNLDVAVRMVSRKVDVLLIGKLIGTEAVAIYQIGVRVSAILAKAANPLYQSIYPELANLLAKGNDVGAKKMAMKFVGYLAVASVTFYTGFIIFGKQAIVVGFGDEFLGSYLVTAIYLIPVMIATITTPLAPMMLAKGLNKQAFYNQLYSTFAYLLVLYPFTLYFGLNGAAGSYLVFYLFWVFLSIRSLRLENA